MKTGELLRPGQLSGSLPNMIPSGSARKAILRPAAVIRHGTVTVTKASTADASASASASASADASAVTSAVARAAAGLGGSPRHGDHAEQRGQRNGQSDEVGGGEVAQRVQRPGESDDQHRDDEPQPRRNSRSVNGSAGGVTSGTAVTDLAPPASAMRPAVPASLVTRELAPRQQFRQLDLARVDAPDHGHHDGGQPGGSEPQPGGGGVAGTFC